MSVKGIITTHGQNTLYKYLMTNLTTVCSNSQSQSTANEDLTVVTRLWAVRSEKQGMILGMSRDVSF